MQIKLLEILACPSCLGPLSCVREGSPSEDEIVSGQLKCRRCPRTYPIVWGIPRFVASDNYASSFGLQWNIFKAEQIDSINGFRLSEQRFYDETGWSPGWLKGKWILDAGCGAGRFLDVASREGAEIVGLDISDAVDAAKVNLAGKTNVHFIQASIYELPFRPGAFDGCYCIGVIQHTPDPRRSLRSLPRVLKEGGRIAFFIYERKPWTWLYSKYLVRPFTKRLNKNVLLALIKSLMPVLFPITEVTFRIPYLGRLFRFAIPVSNYVGCNSRTNAGLSLRQRYRWAIMDTFDMLAPQYDQPQTFEDVCEVLADAGIIDLRRTALYGLCLEGRKVTSTERTGVPEQVGA
jgi:ubiquinone/menaquinone biosynthesis C-methylase UbiE/uncharacterized protein YbaR (Trm112 family)